MSRVAIVPDYRSSPAVELGDRLVIAALTSGMWKAWPDRGTRSSRRRRTFVEDLPSLVRRHTRRKVRLQGVQVAVGVALGGEETSRPLAGHRMPVKADTVLRDVRRLEPGVRPAPRVLGVDDWALRKGRTYGHHPRLPGAACRRRPAFRQDVGLALGVARGASGRGGDSARPQHRVRQVRQPGRADSSSGRRLLTPAAERPAAR